MISVYDYKAKRSSSVCLSFPQGTDKYVNFDFERKSIGNAFFPNTMFQT